MSSEIITGNVHTLETFGLVDGPGVRFVIFLRGCRMRCRFCHNPDTWSGKGDEWTAADLYARAKKYRPYWKNNGGITISGGEPLLQMSFVTELFTLAKKDGIHTALDTAGQPFSTEPDYLAGFDRLMNVTDLFLLDLKMMDREGHKDLTGVYNENILAMARYLSDHNKKMWIRHVLVPGVTDSKDDLRAMREFIDTLATVERVEVLPYHTLGLMKWQDLGIPYTLEGVPAPTEEQVKQAEEILCR